MGLSFNNKPTGTDIISGVGALGRHRWGPRRVNYLWIPDGVVTCSPPAHQKPNGRFYISCIYIIGSELNDHLGTEGQQQKLKLMGSIISLGQSNFLKKFLRTNAELGIFDLMGLYNRVSSLAFEGKVEGSFCILLIISAL